VSQRQSAKLRDISYDCNGPLPCRQALLILRDFTGSRRIMAKAKRVGGAHQADVKGVLQKTQREIAEHTGLSRLSVRAILAKPRKR